MLFFLVMLGAAAGVLSTLAGMGGGMLLVVVLSVLRDAHEALAVTTPALFFSNGHRAWLFRRHIDRGVARAFALGAIPGAIVGGWVVPALPGRALSAILVFSTLLALARSRGFLRLRAHPAFLTPAGVGIGALTATSGGAGMLVGPLYLSVGLSGTVYMATVAISGTALHLGRIIGYAAGGMFGRALLPSAVALLVGLVAGNFAGKYVRAGVSKENEVRIELGALCVATLLAVLGVVR